MSEENSAGAPARPKPFVYQYPQASPCSVLILYCRGDEYGEITVLTTQRTARVGVGRCLSAGGFYEVKDMFNEAGKVQDGNAELYREVHEELGEGIKQIIPYKAFEERVEYLWDGMRRIGETLGVHNIVAITLEVSGEEMAAILALPSTDEQEGKKLETFVVDEDESKTSREVIGERFSDFFYDIEKEITAKFFAKKRAEYAKVLEGLSPRF